MSQRAFVVCDLGFGDAGKGSVVDYLTRVYGASLVVRYNGGAQAAHRVVDPDGREHIFAQFGAGTLAGAATHLSQYMVLNPLNLLAEAVGLMKLGVPDPLASMSIDRRALVITPYQRATNRLREIQRGDARHGSCGQGIGEARADELAEPGLAIRAGDVFEADLTGRLERMQAYKMAQVDAVGLVDDSDLATEAMEELIVPPATVARAFQALINLVPVVDEDWLGLAMADRTVVFEGAQGVLLDEWAGFHPHTTYSRTTFENADNLLADYDGDIVRVGVVRTYTTRHGPGPLPTAARHSGLGDSSNLTNPWQGELRVGWFDHLLHAYAAEVAGPLDFVAINCLDQIMSGPFRSCASYRVPAEFDHYFHPGALGHMDRIRVHSSTDLAYQEGLGQALSCAEAHLRSWRPENLYEFLDAVAHSVGAPIGITSRGPTAYDKLQHQPWIERMKENVSR